CLRREGPSTPTASKLRRTEAASTYREAISATSSRSSSPPGRSSGGSKPTAVARTIPRCPRTARASSYRLLRRTRSRYSTRSRASSPDLRGGDPAARPLVHARRQARLQRQPRNREPGTAGLALRSEAADRGRREDPGG